EYAAKHPTEEFYRSHEKGDELLHGTDLVEVRSRLAWAKKHDLSLLDWREVFNIEHPYPLHRLVLLAFAPMQQMQGPKDEGLVDGDGLIALLLPSVMEFFGGMYAHYKLELTDDVIEDMRAVLNPTLSPVGFTFRIVSTDDGKNIPVSDLAI